MTETPGIPPAIERGFVRILRGDRPVGCGFLIGSDVVVTCAHVVAAAFDQAPTLPEAPKEAICLDFPRLPEAKRLTARVAEGGWCPLKTDAHRPEDGDQDIALLQLDSALPSRARPLEVSKTSKVWGHPFGAYGYPAQRPGGTWASGQLLDRDDLGLIQIEATKQTGYFAQPGFSGTPVWDSYAGAVVGIIALAEPEPDKRVAFAIPVSAIERLKPGILTEGQSPIERLLEVVPGSPRGYWSKLKDFLGFYLGTDEQPKAFGGRDADIARLNQWLFDLSAADRLLLVAPAGRGKSALLVHWAA